MNKKILLQFLHGFNTGGAETLVKDYIFNIDKSKFDIKVLCFSDLKSPYDDLFRKRNIDIYYVNDFLRFTNSHNCVTRIINGIKRYFFVKKIIHKINPDVIHSHLTINRYVKFSRPKKGTKIIHTVHNEPSVLWENGKRNRDFKAAKWLVKHYGMQFITLHDDMRNEVNKLFKVETSVVLNNGINFERFENVLSKTDVLEEFSIQKDSFILGHVGRFAEQKNHEFIIKVFEKLCKEKENAFLLLIGDGSLKQKIEEELKERSLENRFLILSNRSDIPDLLNAMDCFIFPSKYEGLSISLIEAQKMKLPCIVSDKVSKFTQISNLVSWHSLNEPIENWVNSICNFHPAEIIYEHLDDWNMKNVIKKLEDIYDGKF